MSSVASENKPAFSIFRDPTLAIKYVHRKIENKHLNLNNDSIKGPMTKILPMLSLFLKNKVIAWSAVVIYMYFFFQQQHGGKGTESNISNKPASMDSALIDLMSCSVGLVACYLDILMPQAGNFPQ
ncbi:hypothetical protein QEN19_003780 [Hanseniaspora menglaensis]